MGYDLLDIRQKAVPYRHSLSRNIYAGKPGTVTRFPAERNKTSVILLRWRQLQKIVGRLCRQLSVAVPHCGSQGQQNNGFVSFSFR